MKDYWWFEVALPKCQATTPQHWVTKAKYHIPQWSFLDMLYSTSSVPTKCLLGHERKNIKATGIQKIIIIGNAAMRIATVL